MPSTYTLISSNVLTSSAASVTFSAIPSTYTDLVLRISARGDRAGTMVNINTNLNGGSGNHSYTYLEGNGSAVSSARFATQNNIGSNPMTAVSATANTFGSAELYIPSYTASQNKPINSIGVNETNSASAFIDSVAGLYNSVSAISSITLTPAANSFVSGSSFYLYGIKNS